MKNTLMTLALTLIAGPAFATPTPYSYKCISYYSDGSMEKYVMNLTIQGTSSFADILNESWDRVGGGLDTSYKPRQPGNVRFGRNLIVEETMIEGGKTLKDGSLGGFVRVEGQMEGGFYQIKFVCKRK